MNKFTLQETKVITVIFIFLILVTALNLTVSLRRGRDSVRKNDISAIEKSLDTYLQKYKIYPLSTTDGKIIGCFDGDPVVDAKTGYPTNVVTCEWGESKFENPNFMPRDPQFRKGASYKYISDGRHFELYISLEGKSEAEYTPSIVLKNLHCGTKICNYGRKN